VCEFMDKGAELFCCWLSVKDGDPSSVALESAGAVLSLSLLRMGDTPPLALCRPAFARRRSACRYMPRMA